MYTLNYTHYTLNNVSQIGYADASQQDFEPGSQLASQLSTH